MLKDGRLLGRSVENRTAPGDGAVVTPPPSGRAPDDPVAMTQALVRTPSVNPEIEKGGAGEEEVARLAAGWLADWGYDTTTTEPVPGRFNVMARRAGGADPRAGRAPALLLNGHLDTVGVAGMERPFSGRIEADRLHGRGAADMKAGVACVLAVARELAGAPMPGELIVALTADEEHASLGMQELASSGLRADGAVVCEPTGLAVMPAHKGFLWVEARVAGRAAHGSRPDAGVDAIARAGHLLTALEDEAQRLRRDTSHPLLGPASVHAGTISGGAAPSVYPSRCDLVMERRTLPEETEDGVMAEMEAMADRARRARPGLDVRLAPLLYRAGTEVPTDSPLVEGLLRACRREGLPGAVAGMSAWVDACFLNQGGIPAVCFGPGSIAQAHTDDEWVAVSEILGCARVLARFARRFLSEGRGRPRPTAPG